MPFVCGLLSAFLTQLPSTTDKLNVPLEQSTKLLLGHTRNISWHYFKKCKHLIEVTIKHRAAVMQHNHIEWTQVTRVPTGRVFRHKMVFKKSLCQIPDLTFVTNLVEIIFRNLLFHHFLLTFATTVLGVPLQH